MVCEFWEANKQVQQGPVRRPHAHWSPPSYGSYRANFDAAVFEDWNCAGIGVVYRDHSGHVIAALSQ